jgi:hypothetical protein
VLTVSDIEGFAERGQVPFSVETCTDSVGCVSPSSRAG